MIKFSESVIIITVINFISHCYKKYNYHIYYSHIYERGIDWGTMGNFYPISS